MLLVYGNVLCGPDWKVEETIPPGYSRVYYVYGGEVDYEDEQRRCALQPGCLYLFPSAAAYRMRQNALHPLDCTFLHIDIFPAILTGLVEYPVEGNPALKHLLLALAASIRAADVKLTFALAEAFELFCREHGLFQSLPRAVAGALQYVSEHLGEAISVSDLCAPAGYNPQYFTRLFRQSLGTTPHRYIVSFRLKEAKKMLAGGMSVTQAAAATGYGDIKLFSRSFKSNFGLSPTDFKKAYTVQP